MLNNDLPKLEKNTEGDSKLLKIGDGESFTGIIKSGEQVTTQFGDAYVFTLEDQKGNEKLFYTQSDYLAGLLNECEEGDLVEIKRRGIRKDTRWNVTVK